MPKLNLISGDPSESIIKEQILCFLWYRKVFCWNNESVGIYDVKRAAFRRKNSRFQIRGVADICGIFNGKPLYIEVKSAKGVLSEYQEAFLKRASEAGGIAFVARSVEDVENILFRY